MKKIFLFLFKNKVASISLLVVASFLVADFVSAWTLEGAAAGALGIIASIIIGVCGKILTVVVDAILVVTSYNDFITEPAVVEGWKVVRDFCNMFFILVLLLIAFASILRLENYSIKRWLPKVILMAILINFSRMFFGLLIDLSQIVMLTFINTFADSGSNFVEYLRVRQYLEFVTQAPSVIEENPTGGDASLINIVIAMLIAIIFLIVATVSMVAILLMFVIRVAMLWILVTLSPLVFLLSSFPNGKGYASKIWGEFTKYLINGPVLAFFIWLSLSIMQYATFDTAVFKESEVGAGNTLTTILTSNSFMSFVMAIGMIVAGLMASAQIGGIGAGWGMRTVSNLQNKGIAWGKKGIKRASGYDFVSGVGKHYMAQRRSAREDRIRLASETVSQGIGLAKQNVIAKPLTWVGGKIKSGLGRNKWEETAETIDKSVKDTKERRAEIEDAIRDKNGSFKWGNNEYTYSSGAGKWVKRDKYGVSTALVEHKDIQDMQEKDINPFLDRAIENRQKVADDLRATQRRKDAQAKWISRGILGGAGIAAGMAAGPGGVLGALTALWGGAAGLHVQGFGEKIKNAGKTDLNMASNLNVKQINAEKDAMKLDSSEKVLKAMDDSSKNSIERIAATMEAISRGLLTDQQALRKHKEVSETFGNDRKVMAHFEGLLEKHNKGASRMFRDLDDASDPKKQKQAERDIRQGFMDGSLDMKSLDNTTMARSINMLAQGMKTGTFLSKYKDMTASQQAAMVRALKGSTLPAAREKLAHITDIHTAYPKGSADAVNFVKTLNLDKINEIMTKGTAAQQKALQDTVAGLATNLGDTVQDAISKGTKAGNDAKAALGV